MGQMNQRKHHSIHTGIPLHSIKTTLYFVVVVSAIVVVWLLRIPGSGNLIGGLSLNRLLLIFFPLATFLSGTFLIILLNNKPKEFEEKFLAVQRSKWWKALYGLAALLSLTTWTLLFFVHLLSERINPFVNIRILPLTVWIFCLSCLFLLSPLTQRLKNQKVASIFSTKTLWIAFAVLILITAIILRTKLGFFTKDVTVNDLGVPLLEWQIVFVFGLIILLTFIREGVHHLNIFKKIPSKKLQRTLTMVLFTSMWLIAAVAWLKQPLPEYNYFLPERLPPNFEPYPFSDAERYSLEALELVNGSIQNQILEKQMHAVFLGLIYKIAGLDYTRVIFIQTIILALFPAFLFLIGTEIHSLRLGIGVGLFAIFREINQLQAANIANVSNTKLLMSDFPAMLIVAILIWITIRWVKKPQQSIMPVLLGGIIGILSLYRPQYLIFFPLYLALAFFVNNRITSRFLKFLLLFTLSILLTLLPTLIRNWTISDVFWIDNPGRLESLRDYYISPIQEEDGTLLEEQVNGIDPENDPLSPVTYLQYGTDVLDNFARNLISAFLVWPIRLNGTQNLSHLIHLNDNFWAEPFGYKHPLNFLLIILNLFLLAAGLSVKTSNTRRIHWALLSFFLTFNLSAAIFRFSGWRFIMPVDWFMYVWFLMGLLALLSAIGFDSSNDPWQYFHANEEKKSSGPWIKSWMAMIPFIFIGSLVPMRTLFPVNDPQNPVNAICEKIDQSLEEEELGAVKAQIMDFCLDPEAIVDEGILLYPRYFRRGYGYYHRPNDLFYGIQDFSRLTFRVLGESVRRYYLPLTWNSDARIPNGSYAIILTDHTRSPEALVLVLPDYQNLYFISDSFQSVNLKSK